MKSEDGDLTSKGSETFRQPTHAGGSSTLFGGRLLFRQGDRLYHMNGEGFREGGVDNATTREEFRRAGHMKRWTAEVEE